MRIEKQIYEAQDVQPVVLYGKKEGQDQALPVGIDNINGSKSAFYTSIETIGVLLKNIFGIICNPPWVDKSLNSVRGVLQGGTVSVSTVTSVTTVTTVTGLTNIDSMQGRLLIDGSQLTAWALCCRSRIT